nr:MAG TPA: hypothetical protein [Caudoviricetes sp.]
MIRCTIFAKNIFSTTNNFVFLIYEKMRSINS